MVAEHLGDALREQMVFVGGAVAGLLITDPAQPAIRPTDDVDMICHAVALADYHRVEKALRERGFVQDLRADAPICRWRIGEVAVDVMPTLEGVLGFSNRWYPLALATSVQVALPSRRPIRLIAAPVFLATKLEAFDGRGNSDFLFSHDLEDIYGSSRRSRVAGGRMSRESAGTSGLFGETFQNPNGDATVR